MCEPVFCLPVVSLDARPTMPELQTFATKDRNVDLIEFIGIQYDSFGTCLLVDNHGLRMKAIKTDHPSVTNTMREIFITWLQGI